MGAVNKMNLETKSMQLNRDITYHKSNITGRQAVYVLQANLQKPYICSLFLYIYIYKMVSPIVGRDVEGHY